MFSIPSALVVALVAVVVSAQTTCPCMPQPQRVCTLITFDQVIGGDSVCSPGSKNCTICACDADGPLECDITGSTAYVFTDEPVCQLEPIETTACPLEGLFNYSTCCNDFGQQTSDSVICELQGNLYTPPFTALNVYRTYRVEVNTTGTYNNGESPTTEGYRVRVTIDTNYVIPPSLPSDLFTDDSAVVQGPIVNVPPFTTEPFSYLLTSRQSAGVYPPGSSGFNQMLAQTEPYSFPYTVAITQGGVGGITQRTAWDITHCVRYEFDIAELQNQN